MLNHPEDVKDLNFSGFPQLILVNEGQRIKKLPEMGESLSREPLAIPVLPIFSRAIKH